MTATCRNCRLGAVVDEADLCSVFCAVMQNAPIDGLSDGEIARQFIAALTDAAGEDLEPLQRGIAALLFWLVEADPDPACRALTPALKRFTQRAA